MMKSVPNIFANRRCTDLVMIFAAAAAITLPIYFLGIPRGNDAPQHYQFAMTFREALANGDLLPSWSSTTNFGYGDVGVRFYPPLSYYVLAGFEMIVGNWYDASLLAFFFWFLIGGVGVYFWARDLYSDNAAVLAAIVYIFAPYHANQIYNAFTYAEFAAAGILPFCFWFASRVCERRDAASCAGLAGSYALLLLTHIPAAIIGSIGLCIFLVASVRRQAIFQTGLRSAASIALGLFASSFYWVRVAMELPFVNHAKAEYSSGAYDFRNNFLASFTFLSAGDYDSRSLWFADITLLVTLGLFVPGIALALTLKKPGRSSMLLGIAALFCFSLLIATPLSMPLWEHARVLQMIQFPWRAMTLISLCAALFAATGYSPVKKSFGTNLRPIGIMAVGLFFAALLFTANQIIRPALFQDRESFLRETPTLMAAKSYECWWAVWSKEDALSSREKVIAHDRTVQIETWGAGERSFHVSPGPEQDARVATFYYPYWNATVDGVSVNIAKDQNGSILVPLPPHEATVLLRFDEPARSSVQNLCSAMAWFSIFAIGLTGLFRPNTDALK